MVWCIVCSFQFLVCCFHAFIDLICSFSSQFSILVAFNSGFIVLKFLFWVVLLHSFLNCCEIQWYYKFICVSNFYKTGKTRQPHLVEIWSMQNDLFLRNDFFFKGVAPKFLKKYKKNNFFFFLLGTFTEGYFLSI